MSERNPQAEQMADESMVRCLAAQAEAIWPQESALIDAYGIPADAAVLDIGCGTGEAAARLAERHPGVRVTGIDLVPSHLELARLRAAAFGDRVRFETGDAFALRFPDGTFDFTLCRHVVQAVREPELILGQMRRVTRPGGRVHVVAEDYAMMHFHPVDRDTDLFWHRGPIAFAERIGSDLRMGRRMFTMLHEAGFEEVTVNYVIVDTARVPRETFARIWTAWRDGYSAVIARHTDLSLEEIHAHWKTMLDAIRNPLGYGVWMVPVFGARVPC